MDLLSIFDKLGLKDNKLAEAISSTVAKIDDFADKVANTATGIGKTIASKSEDMAKSVYKIGTQSVKSSANYEQLTGVIETLFKDSADIVNKYAESAYKTVGLSANEYMETVTEFSASLFKKVAKPLF